MIQISQNIFQKMELEWGQKYLREIYLIEKGTTDAGLIKLINGLSEKQCLEKKTVIFYNTTYLTSIPPEIKRFKNLKSLQVQGNRIIYSKVSDELSGLIHLKKLYFASSLLGNPLKYIPKSIFNLVNLRDVTLSKCKLIHVSPLICKLVNLERLCLDENKIKSLPSEMIKLINLRVITLYENKLPRSFIQNLYSYDFTQTFLAEIHKFYGDREDKVRVIIIRHMALLKKFLHKDVVPLIGKFLWEKRQEKFWFKI